MLLFCSLSHVQLFWDSMDYSLPGSSVHGISRQEYWSGMPFSSPGDLPDPGIIESGFPVLQADSLLSEPPGKPRLTSVYCLCPLMLSTRIITSIFLSLQVITTYYFFQKTSHQISCYLQFSF